jgi:MFS family permease
MLMVIKTRKVSVVDFGAYGWGIIFYCGFLFWFYCGFVTDGSNITARLIAEKLGVQHGTVLNINGYVGIFAILFYIVAGQVCAKLGPRLTSGSFAIIAACSYYLTGHTTNVAVYAVSAFITAGCMMSAGYVAGGSLVAQWFPKKKGVVMGYTTIGFCLSSAFFIPILAFLVGEHGIGGGMTPMACGAIILGLAGLIFIRNTPQERGQNPDHVSDEVYAREYFTKADGDPSVPARWTTGKLLATKELWLSGVCSGLYQLVTIGVMSQMIVRNMELGFTIEQSLGIMTSLSLLSMAGSIFVGVVDDKIGTKPTMILYGIWYVVLLLINITNTQIGFWVFIVMHLVTLGGGANFTVSLPASIFGRQEFSKVYSLIFPIQGFVVSMSFIINGHILNSFGTLRWAYLAFAIVAAVNIGLVSLIQDHKYNMDFLAEEKAKSAH